MGSEYPSFSRHIDLPDGFQDALAANVQPDLQGPEPQQNLQDNPQHNADQGDGQDEIIVTGQRYYPYQTHQIPGHCERASRVYEPLFANMQQALETYPNWLASKDVEVEPEHNDRQLNTMSPDDQDLAQRLYEAFRNIVDTFEEQEQNASAIRNGEPTSPPKFSAAVNKAVNNTPDFVVQLLCWTLLRKVYSSQEGKNELPPHLRYQATQAVQLIYGAIRGGGIYFNGKYFLHRESLCELCADLVKRSKLMCKNITMGDEWMFRVAWNPEAELRRKNQNLEGNKRRDQQNLVGAQAMKANLYEVDDNGRVYRNENGEKVVLDMKLQQPSGNLATWMKDNVATREGQTDTAVAQKSMGINRKRKHGQQQNRSSKRARAATTVSTSGSPALATSVAPVAAALSPDQQPLGGAIDQQMQAPVARAPSVNPYVPVARALGEARAEAVRAEAERQAMSFAENAGQGARGSQGLLLETPLPQLADNQQYLSQQSRQYQGNNHGFYQRGRNDVFPVAHNQLGGRNHYAPDDFQPNHGGVNPMLMDQIQGQHQFPHHHNGSASYMDQPGLFDPVNNHPLADMEMFPQPGGNAFPHNGHAFPHNGNGFLPNGNAVPPNGGVQARQSGSSAVPTPPQRGDNNGYQSAADVFRSMN
ncbi:hypothetical protein PG996_010706 [Apiospora saccharicola]|uniref:Uncharacterized protein n=1 Tax=Apiospora saccharicola TaxID=335842 RepID=A0ABR1UPE6_9PEZI